MVKIYNPSERALGFADAVAIAQRMARQASAEGVSAAVCGGLAVQLYGFTRATHDIDFIADALLDLPPVRQLTFGGESYQTDLRGAPVLIDWIVRHDNYEALYQAALADATPTDAGFMMVTPEWLCILKMFAQRGKDRLDLLWLLRADGLVDRQQVIALLRKIIPRTAAYFVPEMETFFLEADLLRARDERGE